MLSGRRFRVRFTPDQFVYAERLQQQAARRHGPRVPGTSGRKGRRPPSKRWLRTQARIAKKLAGQRHRRDDFTTTTARTLTRTHSLIVVEDLRVKNESS